jgi:hypothetical protein
MNRLFLLASLCLAPRSALQAQLPLLTAPAGTLRIELGGGFFPNDALRVDGNRVSLDSRVSGPLTATSTPLLGQLAGDLALLLGRPAGTLSLGSLTGFAEQQRGVATLGLGVGITRRLTLSAVVPIVSTRTQLLLRPDMSGATVGLNPADPSLGNATGIGQTGAFFTAFDAALIALSTRIAEGNYTDPAQRQLAEQTLARGTTLRDGLQTILVDPVRSAAVLPTATSADGSALLELITALDGTLGSLGSTPIGTAPALPTAVLTESDFTALLRAPTGFGITEPEDIPPVGIGDVELALTAEVLRRGAPGDARWLGVWARGGARLSTGNAPRPEFLLDQGSGDGQPDVELGGTVEFGRHRFGLRADAVMTMQLSGTAPERPGSRDQLLRPARATALLARNPGDVLAVTAQPFFRLAPHLAITGLVQYQRRGGDRLEWADPALAIPGLDLGTLTTGTAANATRVGLGLSYVHDGLSREGILRMPVEAGLSIERTVASSAGVVATPLTTRIVFRVYKSVSGR